MEWLVSKDLNAKFFHTSTIIRRNQNSILSLQLDDLSWVSGRQNVGNTIIDYFDHLFCSSTPSIPSALNQLISPVIDEATSKSLDAIPSPEEIHNTVKSMGSNKALGPDGLPVLFYKEYWQIIGADVISMVQDFFNGGHLLPSMNHTFIVLIPILDNPHKVQHYRPISLCNVSYKIISKIIATRLKFFLPKMIFENQFAYVPDCLIQDSAILTHEIFHSLTLKKGRTSDFALKIDMSKAYDRIEWDPILIALKLFGFSSCWI